MYWRTDTFLFAIRRAGRGLAAIAIALELGCSANGDQLLGTVRLESEAAPPAMIPTPVIDASHPGLVEAGVVCMVTPETAFPVGQNLAISFTIDRSSSPNDPRNDNWDALFADLSRLFNSKTTDGISVGAGYFPVPGNPDCNRCGQRDCTCFGMCGCPCDQHGDPPRNCSRAIMCDPNRYNPPDVEIDPMPQNGSNLAASLAPPAMGPATTRPALQGALEYAAGYQAQHLNQRVVEVLIVINPPAAIECMPNAVADCADVAAQSNVQTHVVAFNYNGPFLDPIANKGGGKLYQFDGRRDDIAMKFGELVQDLLLADSCQYALPTSATSPDKVSVEIEQFSDDGGELPLLIPPPLKNRSACNNGQEGWFYDRADQPTRIITCGATCNRIRAMQNPRVKIRVGSTACPSPP